MENYNPQRIEAKWQKLWEKEKTYQVDLNKTKNPFYNLMMFPYPSAEGLHVGNVFAFTGSDIQGRFIKMRYGKDVFEPMGFDAFGIHSENYAIKLNKNPHTVVRTNIENFRKQLKSIGAIFDWTCEVDTTSPEYYKWTQWIFLQLFRKGLAVRKKALVNWCPSCKTVLADEQIEADNKCERCEEVVLKKELTQWFFKISDYAERLLKGHKKIDWSEKVLILQKNWIGRSEGAEIDFKVISKRIEVRIKVFTTRPDTLFGATYLVLSPEHELVRKITSPGYKNKVEEYLRETRNKSEIERTAENKEKTGVFTGAYTLNPVNNKKIPIWIADYVLKHYGTGAIMAVPAHDGRDWDFARKYQLPIVEVIGDRKKKGEKLEGVYEGEGILVNSGKFDGMKSEKAREKIIKWLAQKDLARKKINYKLRDWCISRQRYWGPPIPIIHCRRCGVLPVPEKDLPVLLPRVKNWRPKDSGISPLAGVKSFIRVKCPKCKGDARRDPDVSDNFLDSAWYFLRYPSANVRERAFDKKMTKKWLPVDLYIGGAEHSCLHLMYSRFITMALSDIGLIDFEEPFPKFRAHGLITKDGAKMSKSRGNVVIPDEYIRKYGADTFRMYLMFLGPYTQGGDFSDRGITGIFRFLNRVWKIVMQNAECRTKKRKLSSSSKELEKLRHRTIKKVTEDIESLSYNTAIAAMMEYLNKIFNFQFSICEEKNKCIETLLLLLAPFAPHITEELWQRVGHKGSIYLEAWPKYNPECIKKEKIELVIQINGKVRDKLEVVADITEEKVRELVLVREKVKKWTGGEKIRKIIFVKGKLINLVVG